MAFNLTTKQVEARIVKVNGKTLRADIQSACVGVVGHAMTHGSSPLVEKVMAQLENGAPMLKKLAPMVKAFLVAEGPFAHNGATGWQFSKQKRDALNKDAEGGVWDFDVWAEKVAMWDDTATAKPAAKAFDLMKELESLIDKAHKKEGKGECVTAALIPYLTTVKAKFMADTALAAAQATAKTEVQSNAAEQAAHEAVKQGETPDNVAATVAASWAEEILAAEQVAA